MPDSVHFALCTLPAAWWLDFKGVGTRRFLLEDGEPSLSAALLDTEAPGSWKRY